MATLFDEILTKGVRAGQVPAREKKARTWYRETASQYKRVNENQLFGKKSDKQRMMSQTSCRWHVYDGICCKAQSNIAIL